MITTLTYFIATDLFVVERVDEPIFRMNDLDGSFDATMIHGENDATTNNIDEINIQVVCEIRKNAVNQRLSKK